LLPLLQINHPMLQPKTHSVLLAPFILLTLLVPSSASPAFSPVSVEFSDKGAEKILWEGRNYSAGRPIAINAMWDEAGAVRNLMGKQLSYTVDAKAGAIRVDYEGATLSCTYKPEGNRLDLIVEVTNKTASQCSFFKATVGELVLLRRFENKASAEGGSKAVDNLRITGFRRLLAEGADIALGNWEVSKPARVNTDLPTAVGYPITLETPNVPEQPKHPIVDAKHLEVARRMIAPGATDRFHLSLSFVPAGTEESQICPELLSHFAKDRPMLLDWPDRRSIGTLFLANSNQNWPTNPRGWIFGKGKTNDVTTEEGVKEFGDALLAYADRSIPILKEMNAQGVIVWDLEGGEHYHPVTYLADPRTLKETAPEMDRFADAFFKKFSDAGIKTGITIRPTRVVPKPKVSGKWTHAEVPDPIEEMSQKIAYAKNRWGCTIFYLDSNIFNADWITPEQKAEMKNVPFLLPVAMMEELQRRYPDVLIIPEWSSAREYTVTAPYASPNLRQRGTPSLVRLIYPQAFSVAMSNRSALEQDWETYSRNVTGGDILLFLAWYNDPGNELVRLMYDEAAIRRGGVPSRLKNASFDVLASAVAGSDLQERYYAVEALGASSDPKAIPLLIGLLDDPNLLVRKNAILALGKMRATQPEIAVRLVGILNDPNLGMLAPFAADTLGAAGGEAVPSILELLRHKQVQRQQYGLLAVMALPALPPEVLEALLESLRSKDLSIREAAILALGRQKATAAVPQVIEALADPDENVSIAAVKALGEIGDPRAIEHILKVYDRGFKTVVTYRIRNAQDTSLRQLTGEKNSREAAEWKAWMLKKGSAQ